jgi:hypothetical protein
MVPASRKMRESHNYRKLAAKQVDLGLGCRVPSDLPQQRAGLRMKPTKGKRGSFPQYPYYQGRKAWILHGTSSPLIQSSFQVT